MTSDSQLPESAPPPFPPIETIDLVSVKDSKIISVAVYSGRAEITRLFKFNVNAGQNQLNITGLPQALDQDSFRVEGRGAATIHDVTISTITPPEKPTTSTNLTGLFVKQKQAEKALARVQKSLSSLETYLGSLNAEHIGVAKLREVVQSYDATAGELDERVTQLEKQLEEIKEAITKEKELLGGPTQNERLNLKASIGVFADFEGEVKIALIYAVRNATWTAGYDIRVDMQSGEKPATLVYKGCITQNTGEDWDDVPLTLETATPTFGVGVPTLQPWTLSIYRNTYLRTKTASFSMRSSSMSHAAPGSYAVPAPTSAALLDSGPAEAIQHRELHVSSKGNISATFSVPGLLSIPSDDAGHNVTIVKLSLEATMSWLCVPKKDSRVHLKAKIKNASEYTLLPGNSSVYVDGSFISKSDVPLVSPEESFDCPLGLDPSVRVTYHPRGKKVSQSGFYSKVSLHSYTQRITIHNAKPSTAETLKIKVVDQFPISEDSTITVKHIQPALALPSAEGTGAGTISNTTSGELKIPTPLKIGSGVVASWDGADEVSLGSVQAQSDLDIESLGKDGKFCWICSIAPQAKVNLSLQWEVSAPLRTSIAGL
ncbi:hypothetical protein CPB83DRAFT_847799 [Crepidotus variabilis]|uniref:Mucoidy inhibitor A n=1 Tax=Crepidotus variabilis TaxID=179855 RepID=A0A9P6ENL3_9AGAR|nr:hypothetical protein CPB83DRAFT_847799 [Crepidotus variabilis]